jgi:hypothetical protein
MARQVECDECVISIFLDDGRHFSAWSNKALMLGVVILCVSGSILFILIVGYHKCYHIFVNGWQTGCEMRDSVLKKPHGIDVTL